MLATVRSLALGALALLTACASSSDLSVGGAPTLDRASRAIAGRLSASIHIKTRFESSVVSLERNARFSYRIGKCSNSPVVLKPPAVETDGFHSDCRSFFRQG